MRQALLDGLTTVWKAVLDARLAMAARSPVALLERPLVARAKEAGERPFKIDSQAFPDRVPNALQGRSSEWEDQP